MSVEAINRIRGVRCTLAQKAVLTWLAEHAGPDMTCFPSVETIASCSCAGVRTVRRALADLEDAGHISVERRHNRASVYTVLTCQSGRVPERQGAGAAPPDLPERQVGVPESPPDLPERQVEPSGTTNEPPVEPAAVARAPAHEATGSAAAAHVHEVDAEEEALLDLVEDVGDDYLKIAGGMFMTSTVRRDIDAAVREFGAESTRVVIDLIGQEGRRPSTVKSGWVLDRLKSGAHKRANQRPRSSKGQWHNTGDTDWEAARLAMIEQGVRCT